MKETQDAWINAMAENLVAEIIEQMGDIRLSRVSNSTRVPEKQVVGVCATIGGDYTMEMRFFAEESLFYRLAKNMTGGEPSEEDVRDYAMEFINIVCGRFISEIIHTTHIKARLMPVEYRVPPKAGMPEENGSMTTLEFLSDVQEYAVFSWSAMVIEEMMKRSGYNG